MRGRGEPAGEIGPRDRWPDFRPAIAAEMFAPASGPAGKHSRNALTAEEESSAFEYARGWVDAECGLCDNQTDFDCVIRA